MAHTFKLGDKVRSIDPGIKAGYEVRNSTIEPYMSEAFVESMLLLIGVAGVVQSRGDTNGYRVAFGYEEWNYLPEWLELVDPANPVG